MMACFHELGEGIGYNGGIPKNLGGCPDNPSLIPIRTRKEQATFNNEISTYHEQLTLYPLTRADQRQRPDVSARGYPGVGGSLPEPV